MQNMEKLTKSVAVITSTIGRAELERAIQSVQNQTYPAKHYIFVDGDKYHDKAREILVKYPEVIVTYLPMNTGAGGWTNSAINAIAPYLIKEDIFCYLDDDNWYEPNHIESCVNTLIETGAPYVYALRNLYTQKNEFICQDIVESIGFYRNLVQYPITVPINETVNADYSKNKSFHIDTNCYAMLRDVALQVAPSWYSGKNNDTNVFHRLVRLKLEGKCTHYFSVNYVIEPAKQSNLPPILLEMAPDELVEFYSDIFKLENRLQKQAYEDNGGGNKFWEFKA
ncbi:glycosyltransferase [Bibersteinia trehalosi USDA-ARS-USMARC-190]|uniref:Glycosyltransferase n=1 Tax=Bibersteinia trehalosi USDA-ARS-USMARC-190 TaxID=1263832 RepID=W0R6L4_BIBTR|nr:glycosyltransferase [Bibersteinia trehalosi]AHG86749.1 glycosyltransferase [Bibersteinia trehalosi USDA-ARS-USMARC-190]